MHGAEVVRCELALTLHTRLLAEDKRSAWDCTAAGSADGSSRSEYCGAIVGGADGAAAEAATRELSGAQDAACAEGEVEGEVHDQVRREEDDTLPRDRSHTNECT